MAPELEFWDQSGFGKPFLAASMLACPALGSRSWPVFVLPSEHQSLARTSLSTRQA